MSLLVTKKSNMRHPFDLDDFESFLSEQADKHRMYAGDRVWRNIQEALHGVDRWPALTFATILTTAVIAVILTFTHPHKNLLAPNDGFANSINLKIAGQPTGEFEAHTIASETAEIHSKITAPFLIQVQKHNNAGSIENTNKDTGSPEISESVVFQELVQSDLSSFNAPDKNFIEAGYEQLELGEKSAENSLQNIKVVQEKITPTILENTNIPQTKWPLPTNNHQLNSTGAATALAAAEQDIFERLTMEYGPVKGKRISASKSKIALQFYATPSVSYRYLLEDKKYPEDGLTGPLAPHLLNSVNEFVRHQPKLGLEAGAAVLYKISDNFRVKTGLQFNYRQFGISAFAMRQAEPAMLALNRSDGIDSVFRYTNLNAQNGDKPVELRNDFFQVAIPIGFDLKMANIKNVDFFVSASGQLTYNLASSSYLISSDFKNYISQPAELDRRFNINTAVEAFASFDAGGVTWQAGPQIRYQMLPGSKNAYPIREHLIDYGFKVGFVKRIK
jgi:hypothetical protein